MSYDFDSAADRDPPGATGYISHPEDLEAIVTLMELAALFLTPLPGTVFTRSQLVAQACALGGKELPVKELDVNIVLDHVEFLKRHGRDRFSLR